MNIRILREASNHSYDTGGEYAIANIDIYIDETIPMRAQRERVIHAIVENFSRGMCHDKVDELTEFLIEGLDKLEA